MAFSFFGCAYRSSGWTDGSYYDYEVAGVTRRSLVLKSELYPAGGITTPFYIDKSGKHEFIIQEFQAK